MRLPNVRNWSGETPSKPLTTAATPPASSGLLTSADQYVLDVAVTPYAGCGRIFDSVSSVALPTRFLGQMVAPGAVHGRAAIGRGYTMAGLGFAQGPDSTSYTATGGTTGADVIQSNSPNLSGAGFGFATGWFAAFETGATINDTPGAAMDRQYELQPHGYPYVEPMMVTYAASFSFWVSGQVADLATL